MIVLLSVIFIISAASAAPGYPWLDGYSSPLLSAPVIKTAYPALAPAPILVPAPLLSHGPLLSHQPLLSHGPILAPAPTFIKAAAPVIAAPVVKTIAPATSYATITQVHVAHPPTIVKTVLAPQPILAQPLIKSYGFPLDHGYGYH